DELDDLVDVEQRDQQTVDQVETFRRLGATELAASSDDVEPVSEEYLEELLESEGPRLAVHQRHVVDGERLLERCQPVELLENRLRHKAALELDYKTEAGVAIGVVLDIGDALQLL